MLADGQNAMRVLVAEDAVSVRQLVASTVRAAGHEVVEAANGKEAANAFATHAPIDLVVMDAEMPEMDGFEATRMIREAAHEHWIPIIFLSSHREDDYIQRALDVGADVYLRKPVNAVQILGQIKAMERISEMTSKLDNVNHELQALNQKLRRMACLDGLTQIPNRRAFDERLGEEVQRVQREKTELSLLICDIDYFKQFNDCYGHLAGDTTLKRVAKAIEGCLDHTKDLAARYGGEEFVAVLPGASSEDALRVSQEMIDAVARLKIRHSMSRASVDCVSVSIGIATVDHQSLEGPQALIGLADDALYQAKENGRNQAVASRVHPALDSD